MPVTGIDQVIGRVCDDRAGRTVGEIKEIPLRAVRAATIDQVRCMARQPRCPDLAHHCAVTAGRLPYRAAGADRVTIQRQQPPDRLGLAGRISAPSLPHRCAGGGGSIVMANVRGHLMADRRNGNALLRMAQG